MAAKKTGRKAPFAKAMRVRMAPCKCGKGGRRSVEAEYDLGSLLGLASVKITNMPLVVCSGCDDVIIPGDAIEVVSLSLAAFMIARPALDPIEVKFLRKAMGYTQEDLALHLGVDRGTVTRWEASHIPLDGTQSYALRSHALIRLEKVNAKTFPGMFKDARMALEELPVAPLAPRSPLSFSLQSGGLRLSA